MAPGAPPALARPQVSTAANESPAGAAAEATPAQEEPGRLPAQERRTWLFRGMIALLGVLIAGVLGAGVVELRRGGVSVLATAIVIGFCAILGGGRLWLMALGYGWKVAHRACVLGDFQRAGHHRGDHLCRLRRLGQLLRLRHGGAAVVDRIRYRSLRQGPLPRFSLLSPNR
jgi:hypothetical protein